MRNCHYEENEVKNHVTAPLTKPNFLLYMQFWLDFWNVYALKKKNLARQPGFRSFQISQYKN